MSKYKMTVRPKSGLSINILREFLTDKELEDLIDRYMEAKKQKILREFEK